MSARISKYARPNSTKFPAHVDCGRGSVLFRSPAIRYVLPVVWMTSRFYTVGATGRHVYPRTTARVQQRQKTASNSAFTLATCAATCCRTCSATCGQCESTITRRTDRQTDTHADPHPQTHSSPHSTSPTGCSIKIPTHTTRVSLAYLLESLTVIPIVFLRHAESLGLHR